MREIPYPEEWLSASDEDKENWAENGDAILTEIGEVPRNSLESFAIAWRYERNARNNRKARRTKPIPRAAGRSKAAAKAAAG